MAIAHNDTRLENKSKRVVFGEPDRPYKDTPATELADLLEAQYGIAPLNEHIVFELLHRALVTERAFDE